MEINATCTWGDGPDVMLLFKEYRVILHETPIMQGFQHGYVNNCSTDLTITQARDLVHRLTAAIQACEILDRLAEEHDNSLDKEPLP